MLECVSQIQAPLSYTLHLRHRDFIYFFCLDILIGARVQIRFDQKQTPQMAAKIARSVMEIFNPFNPVSMVSSYWPLALSGRCSVALLPAAPFRDRWLSVNGNRSIF